MLSEQYRAQLEQIHSKDLWGVVGWTKGERVHKIMQTHSYTTLLDYGAGHGSLARWFYKHNIPVDLREYEPGRPEAAHQPEPAQLVVCLDVMEHVEPEYVDTVLDHIHSLAQCMVYFNIALQPAGRLLPDGRNAHLTIESADWWKRKLRKRWRLHKTHSDDRKLEWFGWAN